MTTKQFKTNLNCGRCVAAVKPFLDQNPTIHHWEVNTSVPDKVLTIHGDPISTEAIQSAVAQAGFRVMGEIPQAKETQPLHPPDSGPPITYFPLILIVGYLVGIVAIIEIASGSFRWMRAMENFMGAFFLAFSFFKLLNLRGFADTYRMYDVVARRYPAYGYVYPFIELFLGIAYISGIEPFATNLVTLIVMTVSSIGVIQTLLNKRKIRCACLGTVFNLPMSTVTLIEDGLMVIMSATMLFSLN